MSYQQNSLMHLENQEHIIKKSLDICQILPLKIQNLQVYMKINLELVFILSLELLFHIDLQLMLDL